MLAEQLESSELFEVDDSAKPEKLQKEFQAAKWVITQVGSNIYIYIFFLGGGEFSEVSRDF